MTDELPDEAVAEAERLTRRAREAIDENEADAHRERRDALLADHGFVARTRDEGAGDVLVLYPDEWVADGRVRIDQVEDTSRAVEVALDAPGDAEEWGAVEAHNRALAEHVECEHGPVHGANAHSFADFMSNHYARRLETASRAERDEFLADYYPRNAWPSDEQRIAVEESLALVLAVARDAD